MIRSRSGRTRMKPKSCGGRTHTVKSRGLPMDPGPSSRIPRTKTLVSTSIRMSTAPAWELPALYEIMLEDIAAEMVPERPGCNEPRMKRRETKHYEARRTALAEWGQVHAAA